MRGNLSAGKPTGWFKFAPTWTDRKLPAKPQTYACRRFACAYPAWPLEPVMDAFECLAGREVTLSERISAPFADLVHPIHRSGTVFGWEVKALLETLNPP